MAVQLCDSYADIEFTGAAGLHVRASGSRRATSPGFRQAPKMKGNPRNWIDPAVSVRPP